MKSDDPPFVRRGGESPAGKSESETVTRLESWEEIAAYLRRSVRSARRWEKKEGLPVHRDVQSRGESVYAYKEELDEWWTKDARMEPGRSGRLDSWKEIAAHLGSSVRSVRRWEKEEGLPVRRHVHDKGDSVYAFQSELDEWLSNRSRESGREHLPRKSH